MRDFWPRLIEDKLKLLRTTILTNIYGLKPEMEVPKKLPKKAGIVEN